MDVFFNQENELGGHAWVNIGGNTPVPADKGVHTYGQYPNGDLFGKPSYVANPDYHWDDDDFSYERWHTTPEQEKELEDWIKSNYDLNDANSKRNPNYNLTGNDCRGFRDRVLDKLKEIAKRDKSAKLKWFGKHPYWKYPVENGKVPKKQP